MNKKALGELRKSDIKSLAFAVSLFKKYGLSCSLHGTSLWNKNYKDIDLVVFSKNARAGEVGKFLVALEKLKKSDATIKTARGNEKIGFDCDIDFKRSRIHLSYLKAL